LQQIEAQEAKVQLEIIIDLPLGFPINNIISLFLSLSLSLSRARSLSLSLQRKSRAQDASVCCNEFAWFQCVASSLQQTEASFALDVLPSTQCNSLQHTATQNNTLQHTAKHHNTL
jgi:hypothetical protein